MEKINYNFYGNSYYELSYFLAYSQYQLSGFIPLMSKYLIFLSRGADLTEN